jgi:serine/threonine-protein kinase PknK
MKYTVGAFLFATQLAGAAAQGVLVVVGGQTGNSRLKTAQYYNAEDDAWVDLPDLGTARTGHTAVVLGTQVYAIGGGLNADKKTMEYIDLNYASSGWSTVMKYSGGAYVNVEAASGSSHASAAANGKIYNIGGYTSSNSCCATIQQFDPVVGDWTGAAFSGAMDARYGASAAVLGNIVYFTGGRLYSATATDNISILKWFDATAAGTNSDRLVVRSGGSLEPAQGLRDHVSVAVSGKIWTSGGISFQVESRVQISTRTTTSVSTTGGPALPQARDDHASAAVGSLLYVLGCRGNSLLQNTAYVLNTSAPTLSWSTVQSLPSAFINAAAVGVPDCPEGEARFISDKQNDMLACLPTTAAPTQAPTQAPTSASDAPTSASDAPTAAGGGTSGAPTTGNGDGNNLGPGHVVAASVWTAGVALAAMLFVH